MTKLTRAIERETAEFERGLPICVEIHPRRLVLRLKGTRRRYFLSWGAVFWVAVKAAVDESRRLR